MVFQEDIEKSVRIVQELADGIRDGRDWCHLSREEKEGINAIETLLEYVELCREKDEP